MPLEQVTCYHVTSVVYLGCQPAITTLRKDSSKNLNEFIAQDVKVSEAISKFEVRLVYAHVFSMYNDSKILNSLVIFQTFVLVGLYVSIVTFEL